MDSGYGNFSLEFADQDLQDIINFGPSLEDEELYSSCDAGSNSDTINVVQFQNMLRNLSQAAFEELPPPEMPSTSRPSTPQQTLTQPLETSQTEVEATEPPKKKRFKQISKEKLVQYESMNYSDSTKQNTKWGMRILQEWHTETFGRQMDMETVPAEELAEKLTQFYAEARPQTKENKKNAKNETENDDDYQKNTMRNIRGAINRYLSDIKRNIDIVGGKEFKTANHTLNGVLKERMATGKSLPTKHKQIVTNPDLQKISTYFTNADRNPIVLRQCVWYYISIHFISRGLEFHHQLNINSFEFLFDENGNEYVALSHETQAKKNQGGLSNTDEFSDKRMYSTGTESCPVKMLKLFLEKTDRNAVKLFNKCNNESYKSPNLYTVWYSCEALSKYSFRNFMPDISKSAGCSKRYTAHCIRATCIQSLSDAGVETRKIMYFSGHRNEASVRSYSRELSTSQKQTISSILALKADSEHAPSTSIVATETARTTFPSSAPCTTSLTNIHPQLDVSMSSVQPSMLTNSTFTNCSFTFNMKM